jgi:hypothetical protein
VLFRDIREEIADGLDNVEYRTFGRDARRSGSARDFKVNPQSIFEEKKMARPVTIIGNCSLSIEI